MKLNEAAQSAVSAGRIRWAIYLWKLVSILPGQKPSALRTAKKLFRKGKIRKAIRIYQGTIRYLPRSRRKAKRMLWRLCYWISDQRGHLEVAEKAFLDLERYRKTRVFARSCLIELWVKFAMLDADRASKTRKYLRSGIRDRALVKGLKLLWLAEGYSPELLRDFEYALKKFSGESLRKEFRTLQLYASCCVVNGEFEKVNALLSDYPDIAQQATMLPLAEYVEQRESCADRKVESRVHASARMAKVLATNSGEFWNLAGDRNVSIAVVGNSPCEIGRGLGKEIDSHDIVIRFNAYYLDRKHTDDYGSKTDVVVINKAVFTKLKIDYPSLKYTLVTGPDFEVFPANVEEYLALTDQGARFCLFPREIRTRLIQVLGATASSGLQMCYSLFQARGGFNNVRLYGFSMTDQVGEKPVASANYFRQSLPSFRHNWCGERQLFDDMRDGRPVRSDYHVERLNNQRGLLSQYRPLKIRFAGDHSSYHCGSKAVSRYIKSRLESKGLIVKGNDYNWLVVNGEGSMHDDSRHHREKMELLRQAVESGRKTMLVNTVWQDNSHEYDDVLQQLDRIIVREVLSQEELLRKHGVKSYVKPDFSYWADVNENADFIDFKGAKVVSDFYSQEFGTFVKLTGGKQSRLPYVDMTKMGWSSLVKSLRTSSLFITGRHHGMYAACRAEVPFVVFSGNTHKIEGLFRSAGVDIPVCKKRSDIKKAVAWAMENRQVYDSLFEWMREQQPWKF